MGVAKITYGEGDHDVKVYLTNAYVLCTGKCLLSVARG